MKTVSTREIYESILAMRGYDPSNVNVASGEVARIQEFMNEHLRGVWEYAMWPKILLTERRRYRAAWDNEILYDEGAEVYYLDSGGRENYYVSLQGNNVDHQPALNDEWWAEVGPEFLPSIEFRQQGETEIGAVDLQHCVFDYDPRVYRARGKVLGVDFYMDSVVIAGRYWPMRPWVQFRPIAPTLSLQAWSSVKMYAIADVCYLASTGYSYRAIRPSQNKAPESETEYWKPVEIPWIFKSYIVHACHADYLLDPVERDKQLARVVTILDELEDKEIDQQGARGRITFSR